MKALVNRTYAQIINRVVHSIFTSIELPEWADKSEDPANPYAIEAVDVTDIDPSPQPGWSYSLGEFSPSQIDLSIMIKFKIETLTICCQNAIVAGVDSNVLGDLHHYPTTLIDQHNLNGLITESLLPDSVDSYKFKCANESGIWARRVHTRAQIRQLGMVVSAHVKQNQERCEDLINQAISATSLGSLSLVVW